MKRLELRYVAHVTTLTHCLLESHQTAASSMLELVDELDTTYPGFREMFVDPRTETLNLNVMIYYGAGGQVPVSVIDLNHPIGDGSTVTFW